MEGQKKSVAGEADPRARVRENLIANSERTRTRATNSDGSEAIERTLRQCSGQSAYGSFSTVCQIIDPLISIIIPVRNDAVALQHTLDHLQHLTGIAEVEILVAAWGDGRSTEQAVAGRAQLLCPARSSRSALMNSAADVARGDILFFLHADSLPPRDALAQIRSLLQNQKILGGAFEHRFLETRWSLRAISWINRRRYRLTRNYYGDQGIFVRASVFWSLGGYRDLDLMEDLDLSQRLKRNGRTALIRTPLVTSGRRFIDRGPWRTFAIIVWLLFLHTFGLDTQRYARRWQGPPEGVPGSRWTRACRRIER